MSAAGSSRARSRMSPGWDWFPEYGACPTCARCPTGSGSGFGPLLDRDVSRRHGWCRRAPADSGGCSRYRWRTSPAVFDHVRVTSGEHHSEPAVTRWTRSTIYPDMWVDPDDDPRETGGQTVGERSTVLDYLRRYRLTLELKCADLDAEQLARRSVPPSSMSLLGMIRQRAEVAFAEQFVADTADLGVPGTNGVPLRDVLVHMIEEYARHCGHADLLRERIDGRVGQ